MDVGPKKILTYFVTFPGILGAGLGQLLGQYVSSVGKAKHLGMPSPFWQGMNVLGFMMTYYTSRQFLRPSHQDIAAQDPVTVEQISSVSRQS